MYSKSDQMLKHKAWGPHVLMPVSVHLQMVFAMNQILHRYV
jgi:hypothetical protein